MSLYTDYLTEIEQRKAHGLQPKPIEDAALVETLIAQIRDAGHEHRADSLIRMHGRQVGGWVRRRECASVQQAGAN